MQNSMLMKRLGLLQLPCLPALQKQQQKLPQPDSLMPTREMRYAGDLRRELKEALLTKHKPSLCWSEKVPA